MGFKKQEQVNYLLYDTPVENIFISEYAKNAPGDYVKIYLLALMYVNSGYPFDNEKLAKSLNIAKKDVDAAWDYWAEQGAVNKHSREDGHPSAYDIEFVNIKEKISGNAASCKSSASGKLNSRELSELLKSIEAVTGRLLENNEPETVVSWMRESGMSSEIILSAYEYSVKNRKSTRYRYVEKILRDWNEKGINNKAELEAYLSDNDRKYGFYRQVFSEMNFRRNPTKAEMDMMDEWSDKLGCGIEDIKAACIAATGISSPNLKYIDKILRDKKNKDTEADAENREKTLRSVEDIYELIRNENSEKTRLKREQIFSAVPRLGEICEELRKCSFRISRNLLMGGAGKEALEDDKQLQADLNAEKQRLLDENGYESDALDPVYSCSKCSDTGLLDDGKRCSCFYEVLKRTEKGQ